MLNRPPCPIKATETLSHGEQQEASVISPVTKHSRKPRMALRALTKFTMSVR